LGIIPKFAVTIANRGTEENRGSDKTIFTGMGEEIINIHDDDGNNNNVSNKLTVTLNVVT
jgi:hypothetical protein